MNKKYVIALLSISVLLVASILLGTSYALWQQTSVQEGTNEVKIGCFRVTYTSLESYGGQEAGDINLVNAYPISDEAGASLTPYMFTIKNECNIAADYTINLETLNTSNFNTDYLRIKFNDVNNVTNNDSILYASLDNGTSILPDEASLAKFLTSGHLEQNESATFSLRVWVDKNATVTTTNVMGKTWNGKITVLSEAAATPKYTVVSGDLNTVGSIVKVADEEFYVIGQEDATHVKLLSKYPINVGPNAAGSTAGLQEIEISGGVPFSSSNYWQEKEAALIDIPNYSWRYTNEKENGVYIASIAEYVENYVLYLKTKGVYVTGRLIKFNELTSLGCNNRNEDVFVCNPSAGGNAPEWIQMDFWTGFGTDNKMMYVNGFGSISYCNYTDNHLVRPVIILEK